MQDQEQTFADQPRPTETESGVQYHEADATEAAQEANDDEAAASTTDEAKTEDEADEV